MYRDVSCMYPEGYTYLECILMYLKCILHALLHSKRIHMYLDILHVFYTYPKRVQDTFGIHNRYIKIHVSCSLCWCHTGYISRYIRNRIRVSWTRAIRVPTCAPACPVCVLCVPAPPGVFFYHTELSVPNYQSVPRMCTDYCGARARATPDVCLAASLHSDSLVCDVV